MKTIHLFFMALFIALVPHLAQAADLAFIWNPPKDDKSIEYLGLIFGTVGDTLQGQGSPLIGRLFKLFNIAVLAIGTLVVSYTIILSTMNTAQEGEVMGKKWSSIWIPLRCAVGIAFLLPTASGYSLIQILMMKCVLYGVAAADQLWATVVNNAPNLPDAVRSSISDQQYAKMALQLGGMLVCKDVVNTSPACRDGLKAWYAHLDPLNVFNSHPPFAGLLMLPDDQLTIYMGLNDGSGGKDRAQICGSITVGNPPTGLNQGQWFQLNVLALVHSIGDLVDASVYINNPIPTTPQEIAALIEDSGDKFKEVLEGDHYPEVTPAEKQEQIKHGWLFAGSYFFQMAPIKIGLPTLNNFTVRKEAGDTCYRHVAGRINRLNDLYNQGTQMQFQQPAALVVRKASVSQSDAGQIYAAIMAPVQTETLEFLEYLTTNKDNPISSLRNVGSDILNLAENIWFISMIVGLSVMLVACTASFLSPACWAVGAVISILIPILTIILILLWSVGVIIGLYLPLVPYLVFTFTALGWFLLVIEVIAAAPIVALGLVSPAAEALGKASAAVVLIANVFLRPSLMIIGFVIAIYLMNASIAMVNFGFVATFQGSVGSVGLFGCVAILALYGGFVIVIIHECFTLIHVLPDKIMRWISGQAEQSNVKSSVQEVKGGAEKGAESGQALMKGSASVVQEKVSEKLASGGGGGGGSLPTPGGGGGGGGGGGMPGGGGAPPMG